MHDTIFGAGAGALAFHPRTLTQNLLKLSLLPGLLSINACEQDLLESAVPLLCYSTLRHVATRTGRHKSQPRSQPCRGAFSRNCSFMNVAS